ncbi:MAG: hypothetical protein K0S67_43 [Nitrososphaeraceae archaeon]|nr:hypothetical protein [Nitrososphaeraceae archaeon]
MRKFAIFSIISLCFIVVMMVIIISTAQNNISSRNNDDFGSSTTTSTTSGSDGPVTFDDKLTRVDAALNELIDTCSKDIYPSIKETCINDIEEAWWMECAEYYDKLDSCKSGKVENFLKENGVPT